MKQVKFNRNLVKKPLMTGFILVLVISLLIPFGNVALANSDYKNWKQYEGEWADRIYVSNSKGGYKFGDKVGDSKKSSNLGTMADWGCYLVSMAIQIARSGTATKSDFTPWDFAESMHNNGRMLASNDALVKDEPNGVSEFTGGKFRAVTDSFKQEVNGSNRQGIVDSLKVALEAGYYPIIRIAVGNGNHFVAVDRVEGDKVYMFDPGSRHTDFFAKYGNSADRLIMFESDVPSFKANGSGNATVSEQEKEQIRVSSMKWDEGAIKGMPKPRQWEEDPVPIASYLELTHSERSSVEKWKEEVKMSNSIGFVTSSRVFTMVLGVSLILLSLVFIVSYVFDRVTITEFKMLEFITRGKLTASSTGDSTFFKGQDQEYPKLVNTKDMIVIQGLIIGASIIILSGVVFSLISSALDGVEYIKNLFN